MHSRPGGAAPPRRSSSLGCGLRPSRPERPPESAGGGRRAKLSPTTPAAKGDDRAGHLGDLPRGPDARPDPGVRLPGEHRHHLDVRLAAPAAARRHRPSPAWPPRSTQPDPTDDRVHDQHEREVLGRQERHARGRRLQPEAQHEQGAGRLLRRRLPERHLDRRHRRRPGDDQAQASRTTGCSASCRSCPGIVLEKAYVEAKGKAFGTPSGGTMCTGPFKLDVLEAGRRR